MQIVRKLVKAVLMIVSACLLVLLGSSLWLAYGDCTALAARLYHRTVLGDRDFIGKHVRFRIRMMGTGRTPDGRITDFTRFRATDCIEVTSETEGMNSLAQAQNEWQGKIHDASRVVEWGTVAGWLGASKGERAVLLFGADGRAEIVVWYEDRSSLRTIESKSLSHALALERLIQGGYRLDSNGFVVATGD